MSDPALQPADVAALRRAARPLRLAAVSLSAPTGGLALALAAAEALPDLFTWELELVSFSPFGTLPAVTAGADSVGVAASPRRSAPQAKSSGSAARPAPTSGVGSARGGAAPVSIGELVGKALIEPVRPAAAASRFESHSSAKDAVGATHEFARAQGGPESGPAAAPPGDVVSQVVHGVGTAGAAIGGRLARGVADAAAPSTSIDESIGREPAELPPDAQQAAPPHQTAALTSDVVRELVEGILTSAGSAPEAAAAGGAAAPAAGSGNSEAAVATPASASLDAERRALLATEHDAVVGAVSPESTAAATRPGAAASRLQVGGPETAAATPGLQHGSAGELEPDDLAWLVNEALVEQARRHGVDLS